MFFSISAMFLPRICTFCPRPPVLSKYAFSWKDNITDMEKKLDDDIYNLDKLTVMFKNHW